jgi:hypothetical protein
MVENSLSARIREKASLHLPLKEGVKSLVIIFIVFFCENELFAYKVPPLPGEGLGVRL